MRKYGTISVIYISTVICAIWLIGLGWVLFDYNHTANTKFKTTKTEQENSSQNGINLLALGDSLTRGTGDDAGKGYIGYLKDALSKKTDEKITLYNYGIKGLTSKKLASQVKKEEIQRQISNANIIFITIGGNDLFQGGESLKNIDDYSIQELANSFKLNLKEILTTIRHENEQATIYLIGLYNPFSDLSDSALTSKVVRDWNNETAEISAKYPKTIFVPTYDIFQQDVQTYLYTDHFHPNKKGYQLMADRVASLISWEVNDDE